MDRKKDQFWKHVEKLDCCLKCKFCEHKFDGGVSRIKSHLAKLLIMILLFVKKLLKLLKKKLIFPSKKKKKKKKKGRSLSSL